MVIPTKVHGLPSDEMTEYSAKFQAIIVGVDFHTNKAKFIINTKFRYFFLSPVKQTMKNENEFFLKTNQNKM